MHARQTSCDQALTKFRNELRMLHAEIRCPRDCLMWLREFGPILTSQI